MIKAVKNHLRSLILLASAFVSITGYGQAIHLGDSLMKRLPELADELRYASADSAVGVYDQVIATAKANDLPYVELYGLIHKAWTYNDFREMQLFEETLARGKKLIVQHQPLFDSLEDVYGLQSVFNYTSGMRFFTLGKFEQAIQEFSKLITQSSDSLRIYSIYSYIGKSYFALGNFDKAIEIYRKSYPWLPEKHEAYSAIVNHDYYKALNRSYLGEAFVQKAVEADYKDGFQQGFKYYYETKAIVEKGKKERLMRNMLINNYNRLAKLHEYVEDYDSSLYYIQQSLNFHEPDDTEFMNTYILLGDVNLKIGKLNQARKHYEASLRLIGKRFQEKNYRKGRAFYKIGNTYQLSGDYIQALHYYQLSLSNLIPDFDEMSKSPPAPRSVDIGNINDVITVLSLEGDTYSLMFEKANNKDDLILALKAYEGSIKLYEKFRNTYPSVHFKEFLSAKFATLYEKALAICYTAFEFDQDTKWIDTAYELMEKNRGMLLLEATSDSKAKQYAGLPTFILEKEDQFKSTVNYFFGKWIRETDPEEKLLWKIKLSESEDSYQKFVKQLEEDYPNYYQLKYRLNVPSLDSVQRQLKPDHAILEYMMADGGLFALLVTSQKILYFKLGKNEQLDVKINRLLRVLHNPNCHEYAPVAYSLFEVLIKPLLGKVEEERIKTITIIPHGLLNYLPFELLLMQLPSPHQRYADFSYLLKRFCIQYQYSVSLAYNKLQKMTVHSKDVAAFAPVFERAQEKWNSLHGAQEELLSLKNNFSGKYFIGEDATETVFKSLTPDYKILHLATHANLDDSREDLSYMMFSPEPDTLNDGRLFVYELYNLSLDADLVTLSACNTGVGRLQKGEGIMSLSRGFAYAGCKSVVMSLWPASDKSTSLIMDFFYEGIKNGLNKDEALRQAKLKYLKDSDNLAASPYFWGSFVFVGDAAPMEINEFPTRMVGLIFFLICSMAVVSVIRYRMKNRSKLI